MKVNIPVGLRGLPVVQDLDKQKVFGSFWGEVNALQKYYAARKLVVTQDTLYLNHILTYVKDGHMAGLTNAGY